MPVFPSSEWIDAFCDRVTAHPRAASAAANLGGVYRFVVDPAGPLREQHTYEILLAVQDGHARAERVAGTDAPRVVVRTDYGRWRRLLEGRLELAPAVLFGRVRVSGDMAALVRSGDDADVLVDSLRHVETIWLEAVT